MKMYDPVKVLVLRWIIESSIVDQKDLDRKQAEHNFMNQIAIPVSDFADLDALKAYMFHQNDEFVRNIMDYVNEEMPEPMRQLREPYLSVVIDKHMKLRDLRCLATTRVGCAEGHTEYRVGVIFNAFVTDCEDEELTFGAKHVTDYNWG